MPLYAGTALATPEPSVDKYILPYPSTALQPHISNEVVSAQLARAHDIQQALATALAASGLVQLELDVIIATSQGRTFELAASHVNRCFFWDGLCSRGGGEPGGRIGERIKTDFGSLAALQEAFLQHATTLPDGSWLWLVEQADGRLAITAHPRVGNPMTGTSRPLLTCQIAADIWGDDSAAQALARFWKVVNWDKVEHNLR